MGTNYCSVPAGELAQHADQVGLWGAVPPGYLQSAYDPQMGCRHQSELTLPHRVARPIATTAVVVAPNCQNDIWLHLDDAQAGRIAV